MGLQDIAAAIERVESALSRRPSAGVHDDAPALVRWQGGLQTTALHANGTQVTTGMPQELGGSGEHVSPGWLMRAALASCAATRIAMSAASAGIALGTLEVRATSRSDARGLLGMHEPDGRAVPSGPGDVQLHVSIGARGIAPERLRSLVQAASLCSPVTDALQSATPVALRIEIAPS